MKIAFFNKYLPSDEPNGVSLQVHRLATALVTLGHSVTCFSFSPAPIDSNYNVVQLSMKSTSKLMRKFTAAFAFKKVDVSEFDVVHYHGDDYLCRGAKNRVRTFYGSALREAFHARTLGRMLYQSLFFIFEWISCLRKGSFTGISQDTLACLPLVKNHIPCGVPLSIYKRGITKTTYPSILFLGDLNSRKRGALLIDVFTNRLLNKYPDCVLTVVGPQKCNGTGIRYVGRVDEVGLIEEMQRSWIYCMPSSYEGFGVPVLEAMACGTTVVATDNKGIREIIRDGHDGIVCTADNLGTTLDALLSDKLLQEKLIEGGLETVKQFDILSVAQQFIRLYERV